MLRVGVLGAGHLGKIHLKLLNQSSMYELLGFYDPSEKNTREVVRDLGYRPFNSIEELVSAVDVVDIVTPTISHFECARLAIEKGCHIFIEKPITKNLAEAKALTTLASKKHVQGQVGHVERFNPAFKSVKGMITSPMFIESHRLCEFNPRGTDVPVVLDLMIHDIDIVLSVVDSPVKNIHASGVTIISKTPDIANARIEFENGCVANLTASRVSMKNMRKSRFFQKDAYISVDFLEKKSEVVKMKTISKDFSDQYAIVLKNAEGIKKQLYFENPKINPTNAILDELESFASAIQNKTLPIVTLTQGAAALRVAQQIIDCFGN